MDYTNNTRDSDGNNIFYRSKAKNIQYDDGSLENKISSIDNSIGALETNVTTNGRNIAAMNTRLTSVEAAVNAFDPNKFVKKAGDKMTGQLQKDGVGSSWVKGRENAFIRQPTVPTASAYCPVLSTKSATGSWEMGAFSNADQFNLTYISDENYNKGNNAPSARYIFNKDGSLEAASFKGNLQGKATSAGVADSANKLSYIKMGNRNNVEVPSVLSLGLFKNVYYFVVKITVWHTWHISAPDIVQFIIGWTSVGMYNIQQVFSLQKGREIERAGLMYEENGNSSKDVRVYIQTKGTYNKNYWQYTVEPLSHGLQNCSTNIWVDEGFRYFGGIPAGMNTESISFK